MSIDSSSACRSRSSQHDLHCVPVVRYFAAKVSCEFVSSNLRHRMAWRDVAWAGIRHTLCQWVEMSGQGYKTVCLVLQLCLDLEALGTLQQPVRNIVAVIRNSTGLPALQIEPQSKELKVWGGSWFLLFILWIWHGTVKWVCKSSQVQPGWWRQLHRLHTLFACTIKQLSLRFFVLCQSVWSRRESSQTVAGRTTILCDTYTQAVHGGIWQQGTKSNAVTLYWLCM